MRSPALMAVSSRSISFSTSVGVVVGVPVGSARSSSRLALALSSPPASSKKCTAVLRAISSRSISSRMSGGAGGGTTGPTPCFVQRSKTTAARAAVASLVPTATTCTGVRPRQERGPQRRVIGAPRAQLAIGRLPRIDVHERRRLCIHGHGEFHVEVTRAVWLLPIVPHGQRAAVDAQRVEPPHFVVLSWEPSEARPLDEVIAREQPAHAQRQRCLFAAAVPHVLDAECPINRFPGEQHGARAASRFTCSKYRHHWDRRKTPLWKATSASHSASRSFHPRAASWPARSCRVGTAASSVGIGMSGGDAPNIDSNVR